VSDDVEWQRAFAWFPTKVMYNIAPKGKSFRYESRWIWWEYYALWVVPCEQGHQPWKFVSSGDLEPIHYRDRVNITGYINENLKQKV
jgi:hypothetical protein